MLMNPTVVVSVANRRRIARAKTWLSSRPQTEEVLVVGRPGDDVKHVVIANPNDYQVGLLAQRLLDLRALALVDYQRVMALKRRVLRELARGFFSGQSPRLGAFQKYLAENPRLEDYARFRAAG